MLVQLPFVVAGDSLRYRFMKRISPRKNAMKLFIRHKSFHDRAIILLICIVFAPMIAMSILFGGCAHTVEYQEVRDTTSNLRHDTVSGPALIRFIAILNNGTTSGLVALRASSSLSADLFATAGIQTTKLFNPVPHDSVFLLYANYAYGTGMTKLDSITIPSLKSYSMTTVVLFRTTDAADPNRIFPVFADDSLRRQAAPKKFSYVRLINGLPDYPVPSPSVNLYLDDINGSPLFKDKMSGQSSPVNFQEVRNYTLVPAGVHQVFVRSETDISQSYTTSQIFVEGQFYTIRLSGAKANGTDQLNIDAE